MKHQVVSYDHWLCLAAAPTFAIMALLTSVLGSGQPDMLCSAAHDASSLGGMVAMYLLMSAFHFPPWLKLISGRRSGAYSSCVIIGLSPHPERLTQKAINKIGLWRRTRHARPCAGHPRPSSPAATKTWMAGTKPGHDGK